MRPSLLRYRSLLVSETIFPALLVFFLVLTALTGKIFASSLADNAETKKTPIGVPVRLVIPSLAIDAPLDSVGLLPNGSIGIPKDPTRGAWYNRGARPGSVGNAIIDGHTGWIHNTHALFDALHTLKIGDTISVTNDYGLVTTFVVRELKIYSIDEAPPSEVFISDDGQAHLVLITCQGEWDELEKSYPYRLVVFSDLVK